MGLFKKLTSGPLNFTKPLLTGGTGIGFGGPIRMTKDILGTQKNLWKKTFESGGVDPQDPYAGMSELEKLAAIEEQKRQALGQQQQKQINDFATQMEGTIGEYRKKLASNLANTSQQTFNQAVPGLLEDLNARGLFTSQTARDQETNRALQELATQQNQILTDYDTSQFGNIQDLRSTALSALLGGDQSALDSALALRKAGIQRSFDVTDQNAQNALAQSLAKRQSRDQLISSLIGGGSQIGMGMLMCFDGSTLVKMLDEEPKQIKDIEVGDLTRGGIVVSVRKSITQNGTRYNHKGTIVTGSHAVFENGEWKRIEDSPNSVKVEGGGIVYALITTAHRIYVNDETYGDEIEVDDYAKYQERVNNETLKRLNGFVGSVA